MRRPVVGGVVLAVVVGCSSPLPASTTTIPQAASSAKPPTSATRATSAPATPRSQARASRQHTRRDGAPLPGSLALPHHSGAGRRVVYAVGRQQVWLVDARNSVVRTYLVSGRRSQPAAGSFRVWGRSRTTSSAVSDATMRYMVRFTRGRRTGAAIGFHDIPRSRSGSPEQSVRDLGTPLSAGCIRQASADAVALWSFAPLGTRVVVLD